MLKVLLPVDGSEHSARGHARAGDPHWYRYRPEYHLLNVQLPVASGAVKMFISREQLNDFYQEEGETAFEVAREALQSAGVASMPRLPLARLPLPSHAMPRSKKSA